MSLDAIEELAALQRGRAEMARLYGVAEEAWSPIVEWITMREKWLDVDAVPSPNGQGWDIVLRFDGAYASDEDGEAFAEHHRAALAEALRKSGAGRAALAVEQRARIRF